MTASGKKAGHTQRQNKKKQIYELIITKKKHETSNATRNLGEQQIKPKINETDRESEQHEEKKTNTEN